MVKIQRRRRKFLRLKIITFLYFCVCMFGNLEWHIKPLMTWQKSSVTNETFFYFFFQLFKVSSSVSSSFLLFILKPIFNQKFCFFYFGRKTWLPVLLKDGCNHVYCLSPRYFWATTLLIPLLTRLFVYICVCVCLYIL